MQMWIAGFLKGRNTLSNNQLTLCSRNEQMHTVSNRKQLFVRIL